MIVTDYNSAIDAIFALANAAITDASTKIVTIAETRWPGENPDSKPPVNVYWCRVSEQLVIEKQANLSGTATTRYTSVGLIFVQVFAPVKDGKTAIANARSIANICRDKFREPFTDGSIWFRNQQVKPMITNSDSFQFTVVATYQFDAFV